MNLPGDLGTADRNHYFAACASPGDVITSISVLDENDEELVSWDEGRGGGERRITVTGGQVDVDADAPVGRFLHLPVSDPDNELAVAAESNFRKRQLRVTRSRFVPEIGKWISTDLFTGPIVAAPRSGDEVQFLAHGKGRYGMHGLKKPFTIKKGTKVTDAIKIIVHVLCGVPYRHLGNIPDLKATLREDLVIQIDQYPWTRAQTLASGLMRHLDFDGSGDAIMPRVDGTDDVYTFTGARNPTRQGASLLTQPLVTVDFSHVLNAVQLTGGATDTSPAPVAYAFADPHDPYSAQRTGHFDADAYKWHFVTVETAHTKETAQRLADNILIRDLIVLREIQFESMPLDFFDVYDYVALATAGINEKTHLTKFSIPLLFDGAPTMTYNYTKRRSTNYFAGRS